VNPDDSEPVPPDAWDSVYSALAERHRRRILGYLRQADPPTPVDEVVAALSTPDRTDTGRDEGTLRLRLHHVELPKLDEAGLVDWDREAETVALTGRADRLRLFDTLPHGLVGTPLAGEVAAPGTGGTDRPAEGTGD
jgi:DNA-binding transcriptional ArsR family regulator